MYGNIDDDREIGSRYGQALLSGNMKMIQMNKIHIRHDEKNRSRKDLHAWIVSALLRR